MLLRLAQLSYALNDHYTTLCADTKIIYFKALNLPILSRKTCQKIVRWAGSSASSQTEDAAHELKLVPFGQRN